MSMVCYFFGVAMGAGCGYLIGYLRGMDWQRRHMERH